MCRRWTPMDASARVTSDRMTSGSTDVDVGFADAGQPGEGLGGQRIAAQLAA